MEETPSQELPEMEGTLKFSQLPSTQSRSNELVKSNPSKYYALATPATSSNSRALQRKVPKRRLDSVNEYTVGIITALAHEKAAVIAMLDEQHNTPLEYSQSKHDDNTYSWGRMNGHNVAVVSLGAGSYGTTQSAHTVAPMLFSLPEMRFGLLVGIGAGIPQEGYDIRLGDVAISVPGSGSGGVHQYDAVKAKSNDKFEHIGFLNKPSDLLLKGVEQLQSDHHMVDSTVPEYLQSMVETWPKMGRSTPTKPSFSHQGSANDHLFPASSPHVLGEKDCGKCDHKMVIERPTRDTSDPEFHYGVIASGNTLVKDSIHRDELVSRVPGCICFEMEAAGVMNKLPCLVIRGICDYADSHKNDRWQNYAAAVAAGYAKELLSVITPVEVERSKTVLAVMHNIGKEVAEIKSLATKEKDDSRKKRFMDWISHPDTSTAHRKARVLHQPGTCHWFLTSETFSRWKKGSIPLIWIHGIPGSGKTILSSSIIDNLETGAQDPAELVLYFYFEYTATMNISFDGMIRNFAARMLPKNQKAQGTLEDFFLENENTQPPTEAFVEIFESMVTNFNRVQIVIDALDEIKIRDDLLKLLAWVKATASVPEGRIQLIVTSRTNEDIESRLINMGETVVLSRDVVEDDIKSYVDKRISEEPDLQKWNKSTEAQNAIKTALIEKSDGMFRWVGCQIDALRSCYNYEDLLETLAALPQTLEDTYTRILDGITSEKQRQRVITILRLLLFYQDTLGTDIVLDAIIVNPSQDPAFDRVNRFPNHRDLARLCGALVTIDWVSPSETSYGVLRIAHFSVREYLASNQVPRDFKDAFKQSVANASFTQIGLAYLRNIPIPLDHLMTLVLYPLVGFAMQWPYFAREVQREEVVVRAIAQFFMKDAYHPFVRLYNQWDSLEYQDCAENQDISDRLWILSSLELNDSLEIAVNESPMSCLLNVSSQKLDLGKLKPKFQEFDAITRICGSSEILKDDRRHVRGLYFAAQNGWSSIVRAILPHDHESHIQGGYHGTALNAAMYFDKSDIVDILQKHYDGIEPEHSASALVNTLKCGTEFWTPAYFETLLQKASNQDMPDENYFHEALRAALLYGRQRLVDVLLERGYSAALQRVIGSTLIDSLRFCEESQAQTIIRLVDCSQLCQPRQSLASVATQGLTETYDETHGRSPLHWAAEKGFVDVTKALLLKHADISFKDKFGETPLHRAVQFGRTQTAQVLIDGGADLKSIDGCLRTPLLTALLHGHLDTCWTVSPSRLGSQSFEYLLDEIDAETSFDDHEVETSPISIIDRFMGSVPAFKDRIMCEYPNAKRFLENSLNIDRFRQLIMLELQLAEDDLPFVHAVRLHEAILSRVPDCVRTALHDRYTRAVLNARYAEQNMSTPLHIAAEASCFSAFHDLLHAGADPNLKDLYGRTPIHILADPTRVGAGSAAALEAVIKLSCKLEEPDSEGQTSLDLLRMQKRRRRKMTWLHYAARGGYTKFIEILLSIGADMGAKDAIGQTPLDHARANMYFDIFGIRLVPMIRSSWGKHVNRTRANLGKDHFTKLPKLEPSTIALALRLHQAVHLDDFSAVSALIEKPDVDISFINSVDASGKSALHWAVENGNHWLVELLLIWGATTNIGDHEGYNYHANIMDDADMTPLHYAARAGNLRIVKVLLKGGAHVWAFERSGLTPRDLAIAQLHLDVADWLKNQEQMKDIGKV